MSNKRRWLVILGLIILVAVVVLEASRFISNHGGYNLHKSSQSSSTSLSLSSTAFAAGSNIPTQYTCRGENINPPLTISSVPQSAKSLALIMHDPDAVSGDYTHWLVWDIPVSTMQISANSVPVGAVQGANGSGQAQYFGPCPPAGTGTHHYKFELYALDKTLGLPSGASRAELEQAISGHNVGHTTLTGLFGS